MESAEHTDLETWARKFGGTAIFGFISTLLLAGKFLHHILERRGLVFGTLVIPPALLSGLIGLIWFSSMEFLDPIITADMRLGLEAIKSNFINYVFAALILGITCGRANSQHNSSIRGIITSLFHEGMPMVIYSQVLNWGQSSCCILFVCIANTFSGANIPKLFSVMVPLGLEAGADVVISSDHKVYINIYKYVTHDLFIYILIRYLILSFLLLFSQTDYTDTIVEESESLGLLVISAMGILMFTFRPYFIKQGWLGVDYSKDYTTGAAAHLQSGTGQAEAFLRATNHQSSLHNMQTIPSYPRHQLHGRISSSRSFNDIQQQQQPGLVATTPGVLELESSYLSTPSIHTTSITTSPTIKTKTFSFDDDITLYNNTLLNNTNNNTNIKERNTNQASLGAHLSLISLTAFLSFGLSLVLHLIEIKLSISNHWLSGIRMFKLSMCCALISMIFILQNTKIKFNKEWFMHICGLMLDFLIIASISKSYPKKTLLIEKTQYILCSVFVFICLLWNIFCFLYMAKKLFPNFWFERAVTLAGDSFGHSYTGLLFIRTLDPSMESPVPASYAYKLLLFFIPSSGAKQTILLTSLKTQGPWAALFTSIFVTFAWLILFDSYFRKRFVKEKSMEFTINGSSGGDSEELEGLMQNPGGDIGLSAENNEVEMIRTTAGSSGKRQRNVVNPSSSNTFEALLTAAAEGEMRDAEAAIDTTTGNTTSRSNIENNRDVAEHMELYNNNNNSESMLLVRNSSLNSTYNVHTSDNSSIINQAQMNIIASFLSNSNALKTWQLTYSLRQHGASLTTLLSLNSKKTRSGQTMLVPCIVIIEDSWGYVFGGFISPTIENKTAYYGNGESFVFSILPTPKAYKWTGKNDLFVLSNHNCIAMGGGGEGYSWQLDDELDTGVSCCSSTYNNPVLSSSEFFKCLNIEVWALDAGFSV